MVDEMVNRAVVASDGQGCGILLWCAGAQISGDVHGAGLLYLDDLGLSDAPIGVSVWEGSYVRFRPDRDAADFPRGVFRDPSPAEWAAIRSKRSPWGTDGG